MLHLVGADGVAPVGIEDVGDVAAAVSRGEADVAHFLAEDAYYLVAALVEEDDADGKAEVLEVLTHTEELSCQREQCQTCLSIAECSRQSQSK